MAYTMKPSVGMLPINDLDRVMVAQGFIKTLNKQHIEEVTQEPGPGGVGVTTNGIKEPMNIAICAGERLGTGELDRETIKNALNLGGKAVDQFMLIDEKAVIEAIIEKVNSTHSKEIQLLRDELYHLKVGLVRTGHTEDTWVADGYIDGFKRNNIKYDNKDADVQNVVGLDITPSEKLFEKDDWLVVRKDKANEHDNTLATVTVDGGNTMQLDIGTAGIAQNQTLLKRTLGEYNKGTYSFSRLDTNVPGAREFYTMLNDDSNVTKLKITKDNTGYATVLKIPTRCAGFLTKFTAHGRPFGNPGAMRCYVIKGDGAYIDQIATTNGISQAEADGNLVATSNPVNANAVNVINEEIVFDFTILTHDPFDPASVPYPILDDTEYCFVIEAENVNDFDYWEIEFGHKKTAQLDLQSNNRTFKFNNKDVINVPDNAFDEIADTDMLYIVNTKAVEKELEVPYQVGLYSALKYTNLSAPITSSRARLTLEVNKEGPYVCTTNGTIQPDVDTITYTKADGTGATQTVIAGGDHLIIGTNIVKAKTSSPNTVTIDKAIYVEPMMPLYRCGYQAQLKVCLMEEDPITKMPTVKPGTEKTYPLELVAVIPNGRSVQSKISDRLIFEVDMRNAVDAQGQILYFNRAELQIKWSSPLATQIIQAEAQRGTDYVGRIHSLSLAFDKTV